MKLNKTEVLLYHTQWKLNNTEYLLNNTREELKETKRKLEETAFAVGSGMGIFPGIHTWKISGLREALRKAESGNKAIIWTSYFYDHGYKYRLILNVKGQDTGENTHLSILFVLMKGEYDALSSWPFRKTVTITLIDQQEDVNQRENIVKSFTADPKKHMVCFKRPTEDSNKLGYGFCEFISRNEVKERRYIVDDTMFIQVQLF